MQIKQFQSLQINGITYSIKGVIGQGGAGIVYTTSNNFGQHYALKMIRNYGKNQFLRQSVDSEMKIQKMFKGEKYIINFYGEKVVGNNIYILIELGEFSLRNRIEMKNLVQDQYIQMLIDVSRALMFIHEKKIIHRDIKPENIIYSKGLYKITDFGTSTLTETTQDIAGTLIYWAPEILFDQDAEFTQAVDIWSFGVMAFQAYFLIHPFFYNTESRSNHEAKADIIENIEAITPNFTFGRLIMRLKHLGYFQKAEFIEKKLQQTHQSLVDLFKSFFARKPSQRLQATMLLATLQSIQQDMLTRVQVRKSKLLSNGQLPPDVDFFVRALNLFYKMNHDYYYKDEQTVEKNFQLGLRLLALRDYSGKDFIEYHHHAFISTIKQPTKKLQQQVKNTLSEYYFYLRQTKEVQCYDDLQILRTLVCLCSCWDDIREKWKTFLKKVGMITSLKMETMMEFQQMLGAQAFTERQLASIENLIFSEHFS